MNILSGYPGSVFQDFEIFFRTEIDLVEEDIRLVLDKTNSSFITYEIDPGIYTYRDLSKALFNILQHEIHHLTTKFSLDLMILPEKQN